MAIQFQSEPQIGTVIKLDDQAYELIGEEPYTRQDGQSSRLLRWSTHCPDCGAEFVVKSSVMSAAFTRRCPQHQRTGKPVKGKRSRALCVSISAP